MRQKKYLQDIYRTPPDSTNRCDYIRLDKNEYTLPLRADILEQIRNSVTPEFLSCYPPVYRMYEALCAFHSLPKESFLVTAGSDGAIRAAYDAFVEKGARVINIQPNFAMYDVYTKIKRAQPLDIWYHPETLALDINEVIGSLTRKTSLIVLSNPNSPTGVEISPAEIRLLLESAADNGTRVLIDEAYYPFSPLTSLPFLDEFGNVIILRTFSKAFGLASLRAGYAVSDPDTIEAMAKFRPMYEINSLAVLCATLLLERYDVIGDAVQRCLAIKERFCRNVQTLGLPVIQSRTNFVNIVVGKGHISDLVELYRENGILIRPGYPWGILGECIRISIGDEDAMDAAYRVLERWNDAKTE